MSTTPPLPKLQLLSYGILALPLAFAGMPLYIHAPDYYATQHGLSLGAIGIALLSIRLIDAVQDPLIGMISDRYAPHRLSLMLFGMVLLGVSFFMLFHPPTEMTLIWFVASVLLATTAFSIVSINLNTLGGVWSNDKHERTRITTTREALALIGLLTAAIIPTWLMQNHDTTTAFHYVSWILIALLVIFAFPFIHWYKRVFRQKHTQSEQTSLSFKQTIKILISPKYRQYRIFWLTYGFSMLASAIPAILVIFFIRDRLDAEALTGAFLLLYFLSGVIAMPLWQWLSRKYGKRKSWLMAMGLAIVIFIWAFFLGTGDIWQYAIICIGSGIALGAELALPPSILADHIAKQKLETSASSHFAILTFLAKFTLALATGIALPLLELAEFTPAQENTDNALIMLSIGYALIPCLIKLGAAALLLKWITTANQGEPHANNQTSHPHRSHHHA